MENIRNLKLFGLLSDASVVTNEKLKNAYECFMEHMRTVSQSRTDYSEVFRMLNNTRIELVFIESLNRYEQGGKCPEISLS